MARAVSLWVYNPVLSYVHDHHDTEEIVQDTLLKVLQVLTSDEEMEGKFRQESSLKTWVYRIAINKAKDKLKYRRQIKRKARVVSLSGNKEEDAVLVYNAVDPIHPGIVLENKEDERKLWGAIFQLPENQKMAIILAKIDKTPIKEVAEIMSTSPKAVESLLSRAKANLKKYISLNRIEK